MRSKCIFSLYIYLHMYVYNTPSPCLLRYTPLHTLLGASYLLSCPAVCVPPSPLFSFFSMISPANWFPLLGRVKCSKIHKGVGEGEQLGPQRQYLIPIDGKAYIDREYQPSLPLITIVLLCTLYFLPIHSVGLTTSIDSRTFCITNEQSSFFLSIQVQYSIHRIYIYFLCYFAFLVCIIVVQTVWAGAGLVCVSGDVNPRLEANC